MGSPRCRAGGPPPSRGPRRRGSTQCGHRRRAARRRCAHPSGERTRRREGLRRRLFLISGPRPPPSPHLARALRREEREEREREGENEVRVSGRRPPWRFDRAARAECRRFANRRRGAARPSFGPGGTAKSRPRPTLWPSHGERPHAARAGFGPRQVNRSGPL